MRRPTLAPLTLVALSLAPVAVGCGGVQRPTDELALRRVVLYRNGLGYFERSGTITRDRMELRFASREIDDVLGTLTVQEEGAAERTVVSASVPARRDGEASADTVTVELALPDARSRVLDLTYALPAPAWRAAYRVVLPEGQDEGRALFQIWALVQNESAEDWRDIELTLATTAPFSFQYDLRTPAFVERPTVGSLAGTEGPTGVIVASETRARERDLDRGESGGLGGLMARAPAPPSAQAGQDQRGGAADSDGDRIANAWDSCPLDPETYNGTEDEDGCPDRGSVVISDESIAILDQVYFPEGSDEIPDRAQPIVAAVAQTLIHNPQILSVDVEGHAASTERDPWGVTAARAGTVRAALIERGVAADRLVAVPYGASQPVDPRATADAHERNRRVSFHIQRTADGATTTSAGTTTPRGPLPPRTRETDGATEYVVGARVSIGAHSSSMVTVLSQEVSGQPVLLYRPEPGAPRSDQHPYRAARITTPEHATLIPGPVAVYAGDTFAGQGVVEHLHEGETALLPYALDETTDVQISRNPNDEPVRILAAARGILTVEDRRVHRATYTIDAGPHAPRRIVIEHPRTRGTTPRDLPPGADVREDRIVLEIPIAQGTRSTLVIEETTPTRRTVTLGGDLSVPITPYLEASGLSGELADRVRAIIERRSQLAEAQEQRQALREQLSDVATRAAELRADIRVVRSPDLRRSLETRLREASDRTTQLTEQLTTITTREAERRAELAELVRALRIEESAPPPG
ncbi:MAG: OmpA family protein [Deltaproteobacteria bacterium]|nr:OmpA family protein [Deltaproteobacteria bacterium]